ncbi:MAG: hypothetical protein ACI9XZ_004315 [Alphaproteobacteria bacterium]|jgi:hypothetical protein
MTTIEYLQSRPAPVPGRINMAISGLLAFSGLSLAGTLALTKASCGDQHRCCSGCA